MTKVLISGQPSIVPQIPYPEAVGKKPHLQETNRGHTSDNAGKKIENIFDVKIGGNVCRGGDVVDAGEGG